MWQHFFQKHQEEFFKWFNPGAVSMKSRNAFRRHLARTPRAERDRLRLWITQAQDIHSSDLPPDEKLAAFKALPTSDFILEFLKSVLLNVVENGPVKDREMLRNILNGAGLFSVGLRWRTLGALYLFKQALPYLLNSSGGKKVVDFLYIEIEGTYPQDFEAEST